VRILFVHEQSGFQGGVEQNVADTAAALSDRGHECYLAHARRTGRHPNSFESLFHGAWQCTGLGDSREDSSSPAIAEVAASVRPDVIYYHKLPRLPSDPRLGSPRAVRMVHDHDLCCPRRNKYYAWADRICDHRADWRCWLDLAFLRRGGRLGLTLTNPSVAMAEPSRNRSLDLLIVGSRWMRRELMQNGFPEGQVAILPPAVALDTLEPQPPTGCKVLFVGQILRGKGLDLLMRALARVKVPFELVVAGGGGGEASARELSSSLGLSDRVNFLGFLAAGELPEVYRSARVVAVPSRWPEPFGMVGLEAMHHGRPVVAFEVGGIPDWLQDGVTGLSVADRDIDAMARALERVLVDDALAARLGRQAWENVRTRFNHGKYLDRLEALLAGSGS
jgi:glycosyltransferase involved in cell wall biosynthesis